MKRIITALSLFPLIAFACPNLEGVYTNCHTEIKPMKGEYRLEQYNVQGTEVYQLRYTDDDGSVQEEEFRTDGSIVKKKQTIPTIGIKVLVEGSATCVGNTVASKGKASYLGANVGNYSTVISKNGEVLTMKVVAQYLGQTVNKLIQCTP